MVTTRQPSKLSKLRQEFNAAAQGSKPKISKPQPQLNLKPPANARPKGPSLGATPHTTAVPHAKAPALKKSTSQTFNTAAQRNTAPSAKVNFAKNAVGKGSKNALSQKFNAAVRQGRPR